MEKIRKNCKIARQLVWLLGVALLVVAMFLTNEYWDTPILSRSLEDWVFIVAVGIIGIAIGMTIGMNVVISACKKVMSDKSEKNA